VVAELRGAGTLALADGSGHRFRPGLDDRALGYVDDLTGRIGSEDHVLVDSPGGPHGRARLGIQLGHHTALQLRPRPIESCRPEGRPGVYIHRKEHRIIQSTEVDDWRAWMDDIRGEWTQQSGWRYVAVVFPTRDEALALKAEKLRKPKVRGWYTHPTGVYEP
jgi:hypothetical protein